MATKRLKELLEARKSSSRENSGCFSLAYEKKQLFVVFFVLNKYRFLIIALTNELSSTDFLVA